jgi:hypothetical protein
VQQLIDYFTAMRRGGIASLLKASLVLLQMAAPSQGYSLRSRPRGVSSLIFGA